MQIDYDYIYISKAYDRLKHLKKNKAEYDLHVTGAIKLMIIEIISNNHEVKAMLPNEKLAIIDLIFRNWTNDYSFVVIFAKCLINL